MQYILITVNNKNHIDIARQHGLWGFTGNLPDYVNFIPGITKLVFYVSSNDHTYGKRIFAIATVIGLPNRGSSTISIWPSELPYHDLTPIRFDYYTPDGISAPWAFKQAKQVDYFGNWFRENIINSDDNYLHFYQLNLDASQFNRLQSLLPILTQQVA